MNITGKFLAIVAIALQVAAVWGNPSLDVSHSYNGIASADCESVAGPSDDTSDFSGNTCGLSDATSGVSSDISGVNSATSGVSGGLIDGLIDSWANEGATPAESPSSDVTASGIVAGPGAYTDNAVPNGLYGDYSCVPPPVCVKHRVEPVVRPVVDECLTHVPVVRKKIRHQTECVTRHVPVVDKFISQQEEKHIRHVPVVSKNVRNVIECRTRHVPVVKSRTRTVVEPYTTHVSITEKFSHPVEETVTKHIPVTFSKTRPVVHRNTRLVPIVEKRIRPVVESFCTTVPVKRRYVKNIVEQRARVVAGPCGFCPYSDDLAAASADQSFTDAYLPSPNAYASGLGVSDLDLSDNLGFVSGGIEASSSGLNVDDVRTGNLADSLSGTFLPDSGVYNLASCAGVPGISSAGLSEDFSSSYPEPCSC